MHLRAFVRVLAPILVAALFLVPATAPAAVKEQNVILKLKRPHGLAKFVRQVSDPQSKHYRDYEPIGKLVRRFGAKPEKVKQAKRYLSERGIDAELSATRGWLTASVDAEQAQTFALRDALNRGEPDVGRIPAGLRGSVTEIASVDEDFEFDTGAKIADASEADLKRAATDSSIRAHSGTSAGCEEGRTAGQPGETTGFTPNQYLTAYGHSELHEQGIKGKGVTGAVIEIDGFTPSDIAEFGKCFDVKIPKINRHKVGIKNLLAPGLETTLDLEILSSAAPELKSIEVYEGLGSQLGIFDSVETALLNKNAPPDFLSVSLESCEPTYAIGNKVYVDGLNYAFGLGAGAGIASFVASGDQGSSMCTQADGTGIPILATSVPATSQYVTAVGGTNLSLNAANEITEQPVWNDSPQIYNGGGGGFSIYTARPWWQRGAVPGTTARGARTVPDISGLADLIPGYAIRCTAPNGCLNAGSNVPGWVAAGGTSISTPLFAGAYALSVQASRDKGHPAPGFANPLIYASGKSAFSDVTQGGNDLGLAIPAAAGGGAPLGCCPASKGYDLASGWGSPKVPALVNAALKAYPKR